VASSGSPEDQPREIDEIARLGAFYAQSAAPLDRMLAEDRTLPPDIARLTAAIKDTEARVLPLIGKVIELQKAGQREQAQQMTSAAADLRAQAETLVQSVAVFRLDGGAGAPSAPVVQPWPHRPAGLARDLSPA
jgi:methyl-accepting chemotaxis protein